MHAFPSMIAMFSCRVERRSTIAKHLFLCPNLRPYSLVLSSLTAVSPGSHAPGWYKAVLAKSGIVLLPRSNTFRGGMMAWDYTAWVLANPAHKAMSTCHDLSSTQTLEWGLWHHCRFIFLTSRPRDQIWLGCSEPKALVVYRRIPASLRQREKPVSHRGRGAWSGNWLLRPGSWKDTCITVTINTLF